MFPWWTGLFFFMKWSSLSVIDFFALKYSLCDIDIVLPAPFSLASFSILLFNLFVSLSVKSNSIRQNTVRPSFSIQYGHPCFLIDYLEHFNVIVGMFGFQATILAVYFLYIPSLLLCSLIPLFLLPLFSLDYVFFCWLLSYDTLYFYFNDYFRVYSI